MTISKQYDIDPVLISAVEDVNVQQKTHLAEVVKQQVGDDNKRVSILGIAFKDKTPVTEASPAIDLIDELLKQDILVTIYDPLAMDDAQVLFHDKISYANSIEECLESSSVCVLTLMSYEYKKAVEKFEPADSLTIVDCWRQIDENNLSEKIKVRAIGRTDSTELNESNRKAIAKESI